MKIRCSPEEFVVEEVMAESVRVRLRPRPDPAARFAVLELRKRSLSTPEAVAKLARAMNLPRGAVDYAGLKDKHAQTVQHVSAAWDGRDTRRRFGSEAEGWSARVLGWSLEPAAPEWIERNRFLIVVRGLSELDSNEMVRRSTMLAEGDSLLCVNYFGAQRFGSSRHGAGFAAKHLVRGDFEGAMKLLMGTPARKDSGARRTLTRVLAEKWGEWAATLEQVPRCAERRAVEVLAGGGSYREAFGALPSFDQQMCVDAYQSLLWNRAAARLADRMLEEAGASPVAVSQGAEAGPMVFPPAAAIGAPWREVTMPMPGPGLVPAGPWGEVMESVLRDEGVKADELKVSGLRRPRFGTPERSLVVRAEGIALGEQSRDDDAASGAARVFKRMVGFSLPRGAYATVVLKALGG